MPITDFVSQFAIGDNLAISGELLARSRRLVLDSKMQIFRARMRLLLTQGGKTIH